MITRSAGAIIFRREKGKIYYLLLNYSAIGKVEKTYWGFAKGTIEQDEKEIDTIKREVEEETGIKDLKFIEGFKETEKYFFRYGGETILKTVFYLLAETRIKEIKISWEHKGFEWLEYEKAIERLTFKNAKEILKKANDFLLDELNGKIGGHNQGSKKKEYLLKEEGVVIKNRRIVL